MFVLRFFPRENYNAVGSNVLTSVCSNAEFNALDRISCTALTDLAAGTAKNRPGGEQTDDVLAFNPMQAVAAGRRAANRISKVLCNRASTYITGRWSDPTSFWKTKSRLHGVSVTNYERAECSQSKGKLLG